MCKCLIFWRKTKWWYTLLNKPPDRHMQWSWGLVGIYQKQGHAKQSLFWFSKNYPWGKRRDSKRDPKTLLIADSCSLLSTSQVPETVGVPLQNTSLHPGKSMTRRYYCNARVMWWQVQGHKAVRIGNAPLHYTADFFSKSGLLGKVFTWWLHLCVLNNLRVFVHSMLTGSLAYSLH